MTSTEAEIFIVAVSGCGDCMSVMEVLRQYRDVTLQESLRNNLGDIAQYVDLKQAEAEAMGFPLAQITITASHYGLPFFSRILL